MAQTQAGSGKHGVIVEIRRIIQKRQNPAALPPEAAVVAGFLMTSLNEHDELQIHLCDNWEIRVSIRYAGPESGFLYLWYRRQEGGRSDDSTVQSAEIRL